VITENANTTSTQCDAYTQRHSQNTDDMYGCKKNGDDELVDDNVAAAAGSVDDGATELRS